MRPFKAEVERSFSRAARTYDAFADVQTEVARKLVALAPGRDVFRILETGCGTGIYLALLAKTYPQAEIWAVDISEAMLAQAAARFDTCPRVHMCLGDGQRLGSVVPGAFDLVTSSSTMHWFDDVEGAMRDYHARLQRGGLFTAALFGPETLRELREVLRVCRGGDLRLPANGFPSAQDLERSLGRSFETWTLEEVFWPQTYESVISLLRILKRTGVAPRQPSGPLFLTRGHLEELERSFERMYGGIQGTYHVFFVTGRRE